MRETAVRGTSVPCTRLHVCVSVYRRVIVVVKHGGARPTVTGVADELVRILLILFEPLFFRPFLSSPYGRATPCLHNARKRASYVIRIIGRTKERRRRRISIVRNISAP